MMAPINVEHFLAIITILVIELYGFGYKVNSFQRGGGGCTRSEPIGQGADRLTVIHLWSHTPHKKMQQCLHIKLMFLLLGKVQSSKYVTKIHYANMVEPCYNKDIGTMRTTLLYHGVKQSNIRSWDKQNYLVISHLCITRCFVKGAKCIIIGTPNFKDTQKYWNPSCRDSLIFQQSLL